MRVGEVALDIPRVRQGRVEEEYAALEQRAAGHRPGAIHIGKGGRAQRDRSSLISIPWVVVVDNDKQLGVHVSEAERRKDHAADDEEIKHERESLAGVRHAFDDIRNCRADVHDIHELKS